MLPPVSRIWLWLVPLILITFWLGARGLNADPAWRDERRSINDAGGWPYEPRTLAQVWEGVSIRNPWHAPGYFMVLSVWGRIVGWEPAALRAWSLLIGVLAVAWTYRLGRDMVSPRAGLYAAAVVGTSAFFVHFLHELRTYTLFALLAPFTLWVYWRIITSRREPGILLWFGLWVGAVAMLYTHYFASLPLFAMGFYHLIFVKKTRRWWQVVAVMALAGLFFLPWVSSLIAGLDRASSPAAGNVRNRAATAPQTVERLAYLLSNGSLLMLGLVSLFSLTARGRGVRQIWFFVLSNLALILVVNAGLHVMTLTRLRYLLGLWPLLAIIVGMGIARLGRWRWLSPLALGLWLAIGVGQSLDPDYINPDIADGTGYLFPWQVARSVMVPYIQPGDALVLHLPDGTGSVTSTNQSLTDFYLKGSLVRITMVESLRDQQQQVSVQDRALDFVRQSPRVWVGYEADRRPTALPRFEAALSEDYVACETSIERSPAHFDLYARSPVCCLPEADATPRLRFGDGISLMSMAPLPAEVRDMLPVLVGWSVAADVQPYTYSVAMHVVDEDDQLVAQSDYGLPNLAFSCPETPIDLSGLSSGRYRLYIIVYAWETGQRLTGVDVTTGETGDRLLLGTVEVE